MKKKLKNWKIDVLLFIMLNRSGFLTINKQPFWGADDNARHLQTQ